MSGYVSWIEVVWTLAALPGLLIWIANRVTAGRSLRAVKRLQVGNGRMIVAKYSVFKADVFIAVSAVFVLIGAVSMARPPNPDAADWDWIRVALTAGLLGAPTLISILGYRWRVVDQTIINMARAKRETGGRQ